MSFCVETFRQSDAFRCVLMHRVAYPAQQIKRQAPRTRRYAEKMIVLARLGALGALPLGLNNVVEDPCCVTSVVETIFPPSDIFGHFRTSRPLFDCHRERGAGIDHQTLQRRTMPILHFRSRCAPRASGAHLVSPEAQWLSGNTEKDFPGHDISVSSRCASARKKRSAANPRSFLKSLWRGRLVRLISLARGSWAGRPRHACIWSPAHLFILSSS
jgi:hypothetical protein